MKYIKCQTGLTPELYIVFCLYVLTLDSTQSFFFNCYIHPAVPENVALGTGQKSDKLFFAACSTPDPCSLSWYCGISLSFINTYHIKVLKLHSHQFGTKSCVNNGRILSRWERDTPFVGNGTYANIIQK